MIAKYAGRCACGARFSAGSQIGYDKGQVTHCPSCRPAAPAYRPRRRLSHAEERAAVRSARGFDAGNRKIIDDVIFTAAQDFEFLQSLEGAMRSARAKHRREMGERR